MSIVDKVFGKKEGQAVCNGTCKRTLPVTELTKFRGGLWCEGCLKIEKAGQSGKFAQSMQSSGANVALTEAAQLASAERREIGMTKEDCRAVDIALSFIKNSGAPHQVTHKQVCGMIKPWAEDNFKYARQTNTVLVPKDLFARCKGYPPFNDLCARAAIADDEIIDIIEGEYKKR